MCPRYLNIGTFLTAVPQILLSDGLAQISSCTLRAMLSFLFTEIISPYLVNVKLATTRFFF